MKFHSVLMVLSALSLAACSGNYHAEAPKGHPEALLSASSESVKFSVEDELALSSLENWVKEDTPTRAQLMCQEVDDTCNAVRGLFDQYKVDYQLVEGNGYQAELVYERVVAKPCDAQFRSNHRNSNNRNHPAYGCATAMNAVQMVRDYRQFTSPAMSDQQDAELAVKNIRRYQGINDPYYPY